MNPMLERSARAICEAARVDPDAPGKNRMPEFVRWEHEARQSIAAVRAPDQAMLDMALAKIGTDVSADLAIRVWQAIVDEVIAVSIAQN